MSQLCLRIHLGSRGLKRCAFSIAVTALPTAGLSHTCDTRHCRRRHVHRMFATSAETLTSKQPVFT